MTRTAAEKLGSKEPALDSHEPALRQGSPEGRQLVFVQHNPLEQLGLAPAFIIDLILPASSLSQLLLWFVLSSASWAERAEDKPEVGQGIRRKV